MGSQPKLVCVTGPDGSGKTTQIAKLAERIERRGKRKAAAVTIWDLLLDPSVKSKVPFRNPAEVDAYLEVLHSTSRAMFLFHCFYQALELAKRRGPDVCLLNAYWYKYYATEVAHGGDPRTLRRLAEVFPEPDLTFYLKVDPEEAFRRKARLSGYECGFPKERTQGAFVEFQIRAYRALDGLSQGWVPLNGGESIDALTDQILARMDREKAC